MMKAFPLFTRRAFLALLAILPQTACGKETISVGGARFRVVRKGNAPRRYVHIHGNESTARAGLAEHLRNGAGVAFFVEGNERTVKTEGLTLDPNRMFSAEGARANLRRLNPEAPLAQIEGAVALLERELPALLTELLPPQGALLFSAHNNSQGYNIQAEIPISEAHHLPVPEEPNNFFLATDPRDFAILRQSRYNAVLQGNPPPPDDGSLSRLCASRGIRYVNLEVKLGETDRQREMLAWVDDALPQRH